MTKIDHITKITWTQPDGKLGYCYHVFYKPTRGRANGRHYLYSFQDTLPTSIVLFLINAQECQTTYTAKNKLEVFK